MKRGKMIQEQEKVRNLPGNFSTFSAYDAETGPATAELSIDIRDVSYQEAPKIKAALRKECNKMKRFKDTTYDGVTLKKEDIKSTRLIVYIPSSTKGREVDRTQYDQAIKDIQAQYPDIQIITKEID